MRKQLLFYVLLLSAFSSFAQNDSPPKNPNLPTYTVTNSAQNIIAQAFQSGAVVVKIGTITKVQQLHELAISHLVLHPVLPYLASCSKDGTVKVWDYSSDEIIFSSPKMFSKPGLPYPISFAFFNTDDVHITYGGYEGKLYQSNFNFSDSNNYVELQDFGTPIVQAAWNTAEAFIALSVGTDVKLIDVTSLEITTFNHPEDKRMNALKFTEDDQQILARSYDGFLTIFDLASDTSFEIVQSAKTPFTDALSAVSPITTTGATIIPTTVENTPNFSTETEDYIWSSFLIMPNEDND